MPILNVTLVVAENEHPAPDCARRICEAAAPILGSQPGGTWVILEAVLEHNYAEDSGGPPAGVRPAFIRVLQFEAGDAAQRRAQARKLANHLAPILARPGDNIHIIFEPAGKGRVAFGGRLRE